MYHISPMTGKTLNVFTIFRINSNKRMKVNEHNITLNGEVPRMLDLKNVKA